MAPNKNVPAVKSRISKRTAKTKFKPQAKATAPKTDRKSSSSRASRESATTASIATASTKIKNLTSSNPNFGPVGAEAWEADKLARKKGRVMIFNAIKIATGNSTGQTTIARRLLGMKSAAAPMVDARLVSRRDAVRTRLDVLTCRKA